MRSEKRQLFVDIEKRTIDKKTGHISFQFQIGPFKKTMGTTIGGALRRTLLALSKTLSIKSAIGNVQENSLREDLFELSLNLQKITLKSSFFPYSGTGRIQKVGPGMITAQDLELEAGIEVVNPYQYICSVNQGYTFDILIMFGSPIFHQSLSSDNPGASFISSKQDGLKEREKNISSIVRKKTYQYIETVENSINNSYVIKLIKSSKLFSWKKKSLQEENIKELEEKKTSLDYSSIKKGRTFQITVPKKLPFDIVMVDPIYSTIQSCGFEISQTIKSSVLEYEDLIKHGLSETDEFLRFVVISRGSLEPMVAIQLALNELRQNLSILDPLASFFSTQKYPVLALRDMILTTKLSSKTKEVVFCHKSEVLGKLDISHLFLPTRLELLLRREGFVNVSNLYSVPLEFLKRIGLRQEDLRRLQTSLSHFGISYYLDEEFNWDLLPETIPQI